MSTLQIYIPETGLPEAETTEIPWILRGGRGELGQAGRSAVWRLPKADHCEVIVPASVVLLTQVNIPPASRQKLRQMLPFAVEDRVLSDPESIHVAAGPRLQNGNTPVAVIEKSWISAVLGQLRDAGLRPQRMLVETTLPEIEPNAWCVVWNGRDGFVRTGQASGLALDGGRADRPPMVLQRAISDARERNELPSQLVVRPTSRSTTMPDLDLWSGLLGVPVVRGEKWSWARQTGRAEFPLNLLQGEFSPSASLGQWLPRLKPIIVLLVAIVLVHGVSTLIDWWTMGREQAALRTEMTALFRTAFPDAKVIVDPALQMHRKLTDLRIASGLPDASDFLALLGRAGPVVKSAGGQIRSIHYDKGTLRLDVTLRDTKGVEDLRTRLQGSGVAAKIEGVNSKPENVEARVIVTAGGR